MSITLRSELNIETHKLFQYESMTNFVRMCNNYTPHPERFSFSIGLVEPDYYGYDSLPERKEKKTSSSKTTIPGTIPDPATITVTTVAAAVATTTDVATATTSSSSSSSGTSFPPESTQKFPLETFIEKYSNEKESPLHLTSIQYSNAVNLFFKKLEQIKQKCTYEAKIDGKNIITLLQTEDVNCLICDEMHDDDDELFIYIKRHTVDYSQIVTNTQNMYHSVWLRCRKSEKKMKLGEIDSYLKGSVDYRDNFPEKEETLEISFNVPYTWFDVHMPEIFDIKVRKGYKRYQKFLRSAYSIEFPLKKMKYGCYKKESFDDVYNAMKKHFPDMTEIEFVKRFNKNHEHARYNTDFICERLYTDDVDCIESFEIMAPDTRNESIGVTLSIIGTDLECNKTLLLKILSSV